MAWITPVTDRTTGAMHTLQDQNRIAGNLDYLATEYNAHGLYFGATINKSAYVYNDYITVGDWENILDVLSDLLEATAIETSGTATSAMTYENMNTVESLSLDLYDRLELLLSQANNNHYPGQGLYTRADSQAIYSGGVL